MSSEREVAEQVLRNIRRIIRQVSQHSKDLAATLGLTLPQLLCLRAIGDEEERDNDEITLARVADIVQLSRPTVSRIIDRLENAGLVLRERRAQDRRKVCLSLTDAGLERYQTLPVPMQERFLRRFGELPQTERDQLLHSLERINALMGAEDLDAAPILAPGPDVKP